MRVDIDGVKINYEVLGNGSPVLLLHGWGCNIASMTSIYNSLKERHKVYVLDFPGESGESDLPPGVWGVPEYGECVKKFIDILEIKNPDVIGHSFGGRVVIYLASKYQDLFNKIVLTDAAGVRPRRSLKYRIKTLSYKVARNVLKLVMPKVKFETWASEYRKKHSSADYKAIKSDVMRESFKKIISLDLTKNLKQIKNPTLLMWGELDSATPIYMAHIMKKYISDSRTCSFKRGRAFFIY